MKKIKVLWLCLFPFTNQSMRSTGTWLGTMIEALLQKEEIELYCVAFAKVNEYERRDCNGLTQWVIPHEKPNSKGLPSDRTIEFIKNLEREIEPDLIHVWGTESFWGMLLARRILTTPSLLDIQGILGAISRVFYGGLTNKELFQCIGLKEILRPNSFVYFTKRTFEKRAKYENFIISNFSNISVQSDWVKSYIKHQNPETRIFHTGFILREEFYESEPWAFSAHRAPVVFTSSSGLITYKGLHVLFRAIAVLKQKFPDIQLRIGGRIQYGRYKFIRGGYAAWLQKEARRLGIEDSIVWLGGINASEIVRELHMAQVVAIPSFVESFCLALAEAMVVGVPSVASFAGAIPELGKHNESVLYFPVGDHMACAWQIERLLTDKTLVNVISENARRIGMERNDKTTVTNIQLDIYRQIAGQAAYELKKEKVL